VGWLNLKHARKKLLKLIREVALTTWLVFAVSSPEYVSPISSNAFIEWVISFGLCERRVLCNHDE